MGRTVSKGRQRVEMVDADEPSVPPAVPRRRVSRWWWAVVPVAVVTVLVVVQVVGGVHERAAVARLSGVPGVVSPVARSIAVRWSPGAGADGIFTAGVEADGAVTGLVHQADGSQQLVSFDDRTGARRWSTTVLDADPKAVLPPEGVSIGSCGRSGDDAVCLATDDYIDYTTLVRGDRTNLVTVALRDGSIAASRPAPGVTSLAVLPGLVVTGAPTRAGGLDVVATDARSDALRWQRREPALSPGLGFVFASERGVGVLMPPGIVSLVAPDGTTVRSWVDASMGYTVEPTSGVVVASSTDAAGRPVSSDVRPGPEVKYPGKRIELSVDDGSIPGLVLTSGAALAAYDRTTGDQRWSSDGGAVGDALVMLGRVYVLTPGGVEAVDGSSGAVLWRTRAPHGATARALVTDGHHVLVAVRRDGAAELVAYGLDTGHEDWRASLPDGIDKVSSSGGLLVGFRDGGVPSVLG